MAVKNFLRGKNLIALLVFCAGIFLSLAAFSLLRDKENRDIRTRFEALASDRIEVIENGFEDNLAMLYALRDFYASSKSVERNEFHTFAQGLLSRHPDIFEFRWLLRVAGNERPAYEESMRKDGFADLKIKEFDSNYDLINAASRTEYFCITYVDPAPEDKVIFGVDASSDPLRRLAMQKACDNDTAVSTGNIRVIGEKENKYAIRVFLPVYANELPHNTLNERRDNLKGFLALLFQIDKMTELNLSGLSPLGINIYIYDEIGSNRGELLYFHQSRLDTTKARVTGQAGEKEEKSFELKKVFNAAGRKWSIICRSTPEFVTARRSWDSWMALIFGIILTVIATVYIFSLASRSARIAALVEERTRELKESKAQVQRAADEWKDTFNAITDLIFIQDKDFNILRVNKAFCEAFKSRPEDLIGRKCYEVVHNTDKPWPGCPAAKAFAENRPQTEEVFDKNIGIPLLVRVSPIFDKDGKVIGSVHIATDISERKKVEELLQESQRKMRAIFDQTFQFIGLMSVDGILLEANRSALEFAGIKESDVLNKPFWEAPWWTHSAQLQEKLRQAIKSVAQGEFVRFEATHTAKDGSLHDMDFSLKPVKDDSGKVVYMIPEGRDITERKKAEEKIKEAIRIKSEFTSVVSHELRTPLTAIREGICIVLDGSAGKVNQEQKDFLDVAKRNVDRLWRLINNVLDYQRLDSGKMEYDIKENDLNALVREVEQTMRLVAEEKKLMFSTRLAEGLERVKCDHDRITQVLTNLVNNAIKFTDKGAITISTQKSENAAVVSVTDTGKGIKQEDMDKLFQDFSQIGKGKERETGSTGLGLAISKKIVQQHGGEIRAESVYGRGSTFSFLLPLEDRG